MLIRFFFISILTGSVFFTSGHFVDGTSAPKFYFVLMSLLIATSLVAISQKRISFYIVKSKSILWSICIICCLQACYGLIQFLGWLPSNRSDFAITGSFNNPAGFAAVLSLTFPIVLFLLSKTKKVEQCLTTTVLLIILIAAVLSGARAGMLAIISSLLFFLIIQTKIIRKFQQLKYNKLLSAVIIGLFISGAFILYQQKKDSANGRLLIWKVSYQMIKDKPIFGFGQGAFQAKYMDYQAGYFKNNPNSKFQLLADNVKHPFNEFIKIAVEFGIIGLVIFLLFILVGLWKIIKSKNENRGLILSGLLAFLVLSFFSYPLQYVAIWLLLAFYLSLMLPSKEFVIKNTPITIITRSIVIVACTFSLLLVYMQIHAELKWKTIAISSLSGNTEEMLPEYERLYSTRIKQNPFFLYNYGAELNFAGKLDKSIAILTECQQQYNDYDVQMLLADNYYKKGNSEEAVQIYQLASNMIPCRFIPLYQIFKIYKKVGQKDIVDKYANEIFNKKVKIPSITITSVKLEVKEYLSENE